MIEFSASPLGIFIGFSAGLMGLVIGIGGFWLTLNQIAKIKTVAEAQEEAISGLRVRLASFDAIQECANAQMFINSLRDCIQTQNGTEALVNYDKLALSFINISESGSVDGPTTGDLRQAAQRIGKISSGLENINDDSTNFSVSKHLDIIREFHTLLMRVRFYLHREQ